MRTFKGSLFIVLISIIAPTILEAGEGVLGNIFSDIKGQRNVIVVEKESKTLYLVEIRENIPEIIKRYPVLLGKNVGDKLREGDRRTPEGIYFITGFIPPWRLNSRLYGIGAFPINYPNIVDRIHHKTGYGIWVHGRGDLQRSNTNGCISVDNGAFKELKEVVSRNTPVVITPRVYFLSPDEYQYVRSELLQRLKTFIGVWEGGEIGEYRRWFSREFSNAYGEDLREYLRRKEDIFNSETFRKIVISEPVIFKENSKELMYQFKQLYCSDRHLDYGTKRLYMESEDGEYRIIAEEFMQEPPKSVIQRYITGFLKQWLTAWRSQDLERYITFYHPDFASSIGDLNAWKRHKSRIFSSQTIKSINIRDVTVSILGPALYDVSFIQEYHATNLQDRGLKRLLIQGCPENFRILQEEWRPL